MPKDFELVQVHEVDSMDVGYYAEVVIRDKNGCTVYAGKLLIVKNPKVYYIKENTDG